MRRVVMLDEVGGSLTGSLYVPGLIIREIFDRKQPLQCQNYLVRLGDARRPLYNGLAI